MTLLHSLLHTRWRRALRTVALLFGAVPGASLLATPAAWADCPPTAQAPSAQQIADGLRNARDRGMLWRLSKDGRTGWLYGTVHVGRLDWAFPGPRITQALRAADTVALELDLLDPATAEGMARGQAQLQTASDAAPLPDSLKARLDALADQECVAAGLRGQPALLQALALTVLAGRRDGLDPGFAQEAVLSGFARSAGKTVVALETPEAQLALLLPEQPAQLPAQVQRMVEQLESGQARRLLGQLASAWAVGDLDRLANYEAWCDCIADEEDRQFMRRLNDGRNGNVAERIDSLLAQGQRVFAAVGALHMTGDQALPRLMAERGYTVTRIPLETR